MSLQNLVDVYWLWLGGYGAGAEAPYQGGAALAVRSPRYDHLLTLRPEGAPLRAIRAARRALDKRMRE